MRKLFTLLTLLLCAVSMSGAEKIGFTSTKTGSDVAAPTVTTQNYVTVAVARGSQSTGSDKGSMYWGSTTDLKFKGTCERTQYNDTALPASFNDNVWTGASFAIASGFKFTVTDIQVDIAGQDYDWYVKVSVINGNGTEVYNSGSKHIGTTKADGKKSITASEKNLELTGTSYVKVYFYYKGNSQSNSKYMAIPELYLTGTVEAITQTKYTKPSIAVDNYNASTGRYPVTLSVQNEEDGTISYKIGEGEFVHNIASGTVIDVAPEAIVVAYVSGDTYDQSDDASINIPAMPQLAVPTVSVGSYNFDKNTYPVTITTNEAGVTLNYTINGGAVQVYSNAIEVAAGATVVAYATKTNMIQSENVEKEIPAAPIEETATTPTTGGTYTKDEPYVMDAITVPGACIAGQINSGSSPINGSIKTRCNQGLTGGNKGFYVNVNPGCVVSEISIEGCSNQTDANTCTGVYVDGVAINFTDVTLPLAAAQGSTGTIEVRGINATQKIEFVFANTYQAQMNITVTSKVAGSLALSDNDNFNYGFGSFCAPNNFTVINGAAYKATLNLNEDAITLTRIDGVVPANTGVIIVGEKGSAATIAYTTEASTADVEDNILKGTTVRTLTATLKGSDKLLTIQKSTSKFIEYTGDYFPANRAYFTTNNPAGSKAMSFDIKFADATSVKNVEDVTSVNEAKAVKKAIVNGRLVILTENGYVNALGQTVK